MEIEWEDMGLVDLYPNRDKWLAVFNTTMW
jgi:hypothetical protein